MTRRLQYLNLFGVLALGLLCVFQWRHDRQLNLELNERQRALQAQELELTEKAKSIKGLSDDLASFKESYTAAHAEMGELHSKLRKMERDHDRVSSERDQLRESVSNWMTAVELRDERLKEVNARLMETASQLNESITKFNALATNYNSVVTQLNAARAARPN